MRSYIQQNRPELHNQDYSIVSLHLGREFSAGDLKSSLTELGVQSQTSLRLRSKESQTGETFKNVRLVSLLSLAQGCAYQVHSKLEKVKVIIIGVVIIVFSIKVFTIVAVSAPPEPF